MTYFEGECPGGSIGGSLSLQKSLDQKIEPFKDFEKSKSENQTKNAKLKIFFRRSLMGIVHHSTVQNRKGKGGFG